MTTSDSHAVPDKQLQPMLESAARFWVTFSAFCRYGAAELRR